MLPHIIEAEIVNRTLPYNLFQSTSDSGLPKDAKARLIGMRAGKLVKPKLEKLEQALRLHLGL